MQLRVLRNHGTPNRASQNPCSTKAPRQAIRRPQCPHSITSALAERTAGPRCPCSRSTSLLAVTAWLTTRLTWACFINGQLAALHHDILERCNGGLGLTGIGHLHKPETAWPARFTVGDKIDTPYSAIGFEELPYILWLC